MARTAKPMPREREARLFAVAAHVFLTQGYAKASLNRILDDAGMQKSSFYHFFTGKHDLYERMIQALIEAVHEYVHPPELAELDAESYWPSMRRLIDDLSRMTEERPETIAFARVFHSGDSPAGESADRLLDGAREWADAALVRGAELGVVRTDLPASLLSELAVAVFMALDRWALSDDRPDAEAIADRALAAMRRLIEGT